jgi:hypothetical protein
MSEYRSQPPKQAENAWYAPTAAQMTEAMRSARLALAATGQEQRVHAHRVDEACRDRSHHGNCISLRASGE